jgi:hypothetical protein
LSVRYLRSAGLLVLWLLPGLALAHPLGTAQVNITFSPGTYQIEAQFNLQELFLEDWPAPPDEVASPVGEVEGRYQSFARHFTAGARVSFGGPGEIPRLASGAVEPIPDERGLEPPVDALVLRYTGAVPEGATSFTWKSSLDLGSYFLSLSRQGEPNLERHWLKAGEESPAFDLTRAITPQTTLEVAGEYLIQGFLHILPGGLDHVLFVLGLFFFGAGLRSLLAQISAFTLAHTLTLALTSYGVVSLPPEWVEPLIAISISYVAVENILRRELRSSRIFLIFGFGLLHGMGFAGVLGSLGLPRGEFLTALLSFNVGVELGQLAVLALAALAFGYWLRDRERFRRISTPASALIALVGLYWAVERMFF